jgi:hypothetical protein
MAALVSAAKTKQNRDESLKQHSSALKTRKGGLSEDLAQADPSSPKSPAVEAEILTSEASRALAQFIRSQSASTSTFQTVAAPSSIGADGDDDWFADVQHKGLGLPPAGVAQRLQTRAVAKAPEEAATMSDGSDKRAGKTSRKSKKKGKSKTISSGEKQTAASGPAALCSLGYDLQQSTLSASVGVAAQMASRSTPQKSTKESAKAEAEVRKREKQEEKAKAQAKIVKLKGSRKGGKSKGRRHNSDAPSDEGEGKSFDFTSGTGKIVEGGAVSVVARARKDGKAGRGQVAHLEQRLSKDARQTAAEGGGWQKHGARVATAMAERQNSALLDVLPNAHYVARENDSGGVTNWSEVDDMKTLVMESKSRNLAIRGRAFNFSKAALQSQLQKWDQFERTVQWKKSNVLEITADRERSWRNKGAQNIDVQTAAAAEDFRVEEALGHHEADATLEAAIYGARDISVTAERDSVYQVRRI